MNNTEELTGLGKCLVPIYDPETMDFLKWLNNFEFTIEFLHISDNKKVEFLLYFMKPLSHSHIQQKVAPANPLSISYEVIISHFEEIYGHYQGELAANYRFYIRDQIIGESVIQYIITLGKIVNNASLSIRNNAIIMERFLNGLLDEDIKRELSRETNLTLNNAVAIAAKMELYKIWYNRN